MYLSEENIEKYQKLYRARFGKDVDREQVINDGLSLLRLVKLVYKPITKVEYEQVIDKHQMNL